MTRVLAVAQAFKETHPVPEVVRSLESGIRAAGGKPVVLRGSDGGDGLLDALAPLLTRRSRHAVTGPLAPSTVEVEVGWLDAGAAVVESRLVCGLSLVPIPRRDPLRATTRGVGELIA